MPTVFVIGEDWQFRVSVRAELRERGIEALGMETIDDAARALAVGTMPAAVVLDVTAGNVARPTWENLARRVPVIVVASRSQAVPQTKSAAAVLWRPVQVAEIVAKVEEVLKGLAA